MIFIVPLTRKRNRYVTKLDKLTPMQKKKGELDVKQLSKDFGNSDQSLEKVLKFLKKKQLMSR